MRLGSLIREEVHSLRDGAARMEVAGDVSGCQTFSDGKLDANPGAVKKWNGLQDPRSVGVDKVASGERERNFNESLADNCPRGSRHATPRHSRTWQGDQLGAADGSTHRRSSLDKTGD